MPKDALSINLDPTNAVVHWKLIVRAARIVAANYPAAFEVDDISQAIALDLLSNASRYRSIETEGLLLAALKRAGYRYCQEQKTRYSYYSCQEVYSAEEVKALCEEYFTADGEVAQLPDALVDTATAVVRFCDFDAAFSQLRPAHKDVLRKRYGDGNSLTRAEQNAHTQAVRLLTHYLNSEHDRQARSLHDGPSVGNRPHRIKDDSGAGGLDPVHRYQRLRERTR